MIHNIIIIVTITLHTYIHACMQTRNGDANSNTHNRIST